MKSFMYLILIVLMLTAPVMASDWKMFNGNEEHSGFTADTVSPPLALKWSHDLGFDTDSSPIVVDGTIYVGSNRGIHAIDAETGTEKWNAKTNGFVKGVPAINGDTLYIGADDRRFYAIDIKDGTQKWVFLNSTDGYLASPVVVGNLVYTGSINGEVYALNIQTGQPVWFNPTGRAVDASPAYFEGTVFVGNDDGNILALDALTGKAKWHYNLGPVEVKSSPTISNRLVIIGSNSGDVYAFAVDKPSLKWKFSTSNNVEASPVSKDGVVFVGSKDKNIYAIDSISGKQKWSFPAAGYIDASAAISNDIVYFGSRNNMMYALDATSGKQLWKISTGNETKDYITTPAISGNMLYAVTHGGRILAFGSPGEAATTSQPKNNPAPVTSTAVEPVKTQTPSGTPTVPAPTATTKSPGFEYAGLVLLIAVIAKRIGR